MSAPETQSCTREIQVEIPADVVSREMENAVNRIARMARLPGFRRGKVPASVVRARFAEDVKSEVVESLVPKYFRLEVEKQRLLPVSQPRVTDLEFRDSGPLRFKATFEVLPPFEVSGYKDVTVAPADLSVSDDEVEQALSQLREQHAGYTAIEGRAIQDGDFAQVSFEGTPAEGADAKPVKVDDVLVEIGGANTVREFSENLRGANSGDERAFDVSYPADFADQRLAGKTFHYTARVLGIKRKDLPALDDAFAKGLGADFQSVDDVRKRVREGIAAEKKHRAEHEGKDKIVEELLKRHDFPVPEALVERQIDVRLERGLRALAAQGMRPEDMKKMDFPRLRAGQRDAALREVKASLLLDRIADAEHIEVTDEEIEKEVQALAAQTQQNVEAIRARLTREGALDRIRDRIRNEKTLDFLYRRPA